MLTTKNHTMKKFTLFTLALFLLQTFSAVSADNIVTFYHNDVLGSPVASTDSNGNKIWEEQYHPYGERRLKQNPANENDIWYTGKPHDEETGLTYLGARYYDPVVGRFMAMDPVGFREGNIHSFNRFAYANNNPYKYVDPDGEVAETVWDAFNVGLGVASFAYNIKNDNYWSAALDAGGVLLDSAATAIPFLPGGVASGIKAGRYADDVVDATKSAGKAFKHDYKYHPRVRQRGVQDPKAHNFPYSFDDAILKTKPIKQSDGSLLYRKPGTLNGKEGHFDIAVNPDKGTIFHRTFVGNK